MSTHVALSEFWLNMSKCLAGKIVSAGVMCVNQKMFWFSKFFFPLFFLKIYLKNFSYIFPFQYSNRSVACLIIINKTSIKVIII